MGRVARADAEAGDRAVAAILTGLHLLIRQNPGADEHAGMVMQATGGGLWGYPTEEYIERLCRTLNRDPAIWRSIGVALRSGIGDNPLAD
jgi:hypothetical protein